MMTNLWALMATSDLPLYLLFKSILGQPAPTGALTLISKLQVSWLLTGATMDHSACLLRWQRPDYQLYSRSNEPGSDLTASDFSYLPSYTFMSDAQTQERRTSELDQYTSRSSPCFNSLKQYCLNIFCHLKKKSICCFVLWFVTRSKWDCNYSMLWRLCCPLHQCLHLGST